MQCHAALISQLITSTSIYVGFGVPASTAISLYFLCHYEFFDFTSFFLCKSFLIFLIHFVVFCLITYSHQDDYSLFTIFASHCIFNRSGFSLEIR